MFFDEYEQLKLRTPRCGLFNVAGENSDFCAYGRYNKNCYFCRGCDYDEDLLYGYWCYHVLDCVDSSYCYDCELLYECLDCRKCYNVSYSQDCQNCSDSWLLYNCIGCRNCYGCVNLKQAEYCVFNERYSQADYLRRVNELKKLPFSEQKVHFFQLVEREPHVYMHQLNNDDCTGDYIYNSKNCHACYDLKDSEDCTYLSHALSMKDCMDGDFLYGAELCYECVSVDGFNCNFCYVVWESSDMEFCELCFNCKHCFGCIGLKNREYHILNRPYSPEEYVAKIEEIKSVLRNQGLYNSTLPNVFFLG